MVDWVLKEENARWIIQTMIVGTPVLALILLVLAWPRRAMLVRSPFFCASALSGPAIALLWAMFNRIEDAFGLDSIFSVMINLVLFSLLGVLCGATLLYFHRKQDAPRNHNQSPRK